MSLTSKWVAFLLVLLGAGIGVVSLYTASMAGIMTKMGLVGADAGRMIEVNELARRTRGIESRYVCDIWSVGNKIPHYWSSKGLEKLDLMRQMGEQRIECAITFIKEGNADRGIYTMVKGLYYLKNRYWELRPRVEQDRSLCSLAKAQQYEAWVEGYLGASEGSAREVVGKIYKEVEEERARVEELCIE